MKRQILAALSVWALLSLFIAPGPALAWSRSPIDLNSPRQYSLVMCQTETELDCVESFGFIDSAKNFIKANLDKTRSFSYQAEIGNQMDSNLMDFSATVDGKLQTATLEVPLQSPNYRMNKNPDGTWHVGASLRPWIDSSDLLNLKVRLVVRTSYLRPQNIQLVADESDFKHTKIAGGNVWMFEGKGTAVSNYTRDFDAPSRRDFSAQADVDTSTLHFIIHHADPNLNNGYWPARCADKGYSVQAFNSNAAGEPFWDARNQSLNFAVPSPHLMASGKSNVGFFKLWTTDAYMNCQWIGNTLAKASKITIQIVNQDGSEQVATSSVVHNNGMLYVSAGGFHYSAPTIKLKNASPVAAKKTITCVSLKNSKLTKKVTAVSPKCPSGYKLKK